MRVKIASACYLGQYEVTVGQFRQFADATETVPIPVAQNIVATIPLVVLSMSRFPEEAKSFVDFVATAAGREILAAQHYTVTLPTERRNPSDVE